MFTHKKVHMKTAPSRSIDVSYFESPGTRVGTLAHSCPRSYEILDGRNDENRTRPILKPTRFLIPTFELINI